MTYLLGCFLVDRLSVLNRRVSLSIRRFGGKEERWKRKRERAEGEKRLTQMLLLEPSTPTQHDSIPSNQNHFRSLGCQLHVSKSSPEINLTLRSGLPCEQRPFDLPDLSRKIEGPVLAG